MSTLLIGSFPKKIDDYSIPIYHSGVTSPRNVLAALVEVLNDKLSNYSVLKYIYLTTADYRQIQDVHILEVKLNINNSQDAVKWLEENSDVWEIIERNYSGDFVYRRMDGNPVE